MVLIVKENSKGKIELTKEELTQIVEEAKEEGRREGWVYPNPIPNPNPFVPYYTTTTSGYVETAEGNSAERLSNVR